KRPLKNELKSVDLNLKDKEIFVKLTAKLIKDHPDIQLRSITANKEFVNARFKNDPNAFYNYMVKLLLLGTICKHKYVDFMPDRRSERVSLKWNMGEYLKQMVLECGIENQIVNQSCNIMPMDSSKCLELQFIDFYAGLVWSAYEFKDMTARKFMAENRNTNHKLFFPKEDKVDNIVDEAV
ncbi:TPA: DUF3800 domain-containing protein, partial [Acinetobacter baumannii]